MLLRSSLYQLLSLRSIDDGPAPAALATVRLLPDSVIFQAHFPGEPIMPGACIVQLIEEVAEEWLGCRLQLTKVNNLKFLAVIRPDETPELDVQLTMANRAGESLQLRGALQHGGTDFTKFSLTFSTTRDDHH